MLKAEIQVVQEGLREYREDLPDIGNLIANAIAEEYAETVRENYLSGQVLQVITGETRASVKFFKERPGRFGVRPGVGVPGNLNYLAGLARRGYEFMRTSNQAFQSANRPREIAERVMRGIIRRGGYRS